MLNSTEILVAHSNWNAEKERLLALRFTDAVFVVLMNVRMPTRVGILTFMSMINFMLC